MVTRRVRVLVCLQVGSVVLGAAAHAAHLSPVGGPSFSPPACLGTFTDVTDPDYCPWVEQFVADGFSSGCGAGPNQFCPLNSLTRQELALFVTKAHHSVPAAFTKVAFVAKGGGNYTDPLAAMADIGTWCGTPSASNPCLLKILPGVYDIGNTPFEMLPFVDVEGSGTNVTTILTTTVTSEGAVVGASLSEIRSLSIDASAPGGTVVAIVATDAQNFRVSDVLIAAGASAGGATGLLLQHGSTTMSHVEIVASSASTSAFVVGIQNLSNTLSMSTGSISAIANGGGIQGLSNQSNGSGPSSASLTNVIVTTAANGASTFTVDGINNGSGPDSSTLVLDHCSVSSGQTGGPALPFTKGLNNFSAVVTISDSEITATQTSLGFGLWTSGGEVHVRNSVIGSGQSALYNDGGTTVDVAYSELHGTVDKPATGTFHCIGNYNALLAAVACP